MMELTREARAAYDKGVANGTIGDSITEVINLLMWEQEIVSYCSANGTYSFDYDDLIGDNDV